ncbi:MAG: oligosaccharide flippase family protein [Candidatus Fibromonas sp.]|jgi:O-antigen/teichoic acid export membrane protein|nr:oligosaccharide flippase family protein [Candidatus Fibromonas sp.]
MAATKLESDKKFLFKSTLYNVLSTVIKVAGPALAILTARIFGKEEFGIFVSAQLWMLTMSRVSVLGLDKGLNWFLPQNAVHNRPQHLGYCESIYRSVIIAAGITLILLLCANFGLHRYAKSLAELSKTEFLFYALSLVPWVLLHIFGGTAEGMRKPQYKMFITDCTVSAISPLIAIALYFLAVPYALPAGLLCANILGCVIYLPLIKKILPEASFTKNKVPKELLLYSLPRGFSEVVASVLLRIDLWMVLLLLGSASAGVYAVMLTVSNGLRTIRQSFNPILLPVVAGMSEERLKTDLKPVFSYCVGMVTAIQIAIGFFIVLFPDKILMIAGKDFIVQPAALGILLFANLLGGFFGMAGATLNGMGKSFYTLKIDIISLATALILNYTLIPCFGLIGAALSTFLFTLFQAVWNNIYMLNLGFWPYSKKLFFNGIGAFALILLYFGLNYL